MKKRKLFVLGFVAPIVILGATFALSQCSSAKLHFERGIILTNLDFLVRTNHEYLTPAADDVIITPATMRDHLITPLNIGNPKHYNIRYHLKHIDRELNGHLLVGGEHNDTITLNHPETLANNVYEGVDYHYTVNITLINKVTGVVYSHDQEGKVVVSNSGIPYRYIPNITGVDWIGRTSGQLEYFAIPPKEPTSTSDFNPNKYGEVVYISGQNFVANNLIIPGIVCDTTTGQFYRVTEIKKYCFYNSPHLYGDVMFSSLRGVVNGIATDETVFGKLTIGREAFYNCSNITSITFSSGVSQIDDYAFENCFNVKSIGFNYFTEMPAYWQLANKIFKGFNHKREGKILFNNEVFLDNTDNGKKEDSDAKKKRIAKLKADFYEFLSSTIELDEQWFNPKYSEPESEPES